MLKGHVVCNNLNDSLIWKGAASGIYSVKQFCKGIQSNGYHDKELWRLVWATFAPPKVEAFCWQLMKGRIAVREQLVTRGLLDWEAAVCPFCKSEVETISHLFLVCKFSWKV